MWTSYCFIAKYAIHIKTRRKLYRGDQELAWDQYNLHFHLTDENPGGGVVSMGIYVKKMTKFFAKSEMSSLSLVQLTNLSIRPVARILIHPLPLLSGCNH